jgi:site-specific recombinase XerD
MILVSERGRPLTEHRASEGVRQWRDKAGLSPDLRLYDCRGTAATNLLRAGAKLSHIAAVFGWSLRYAQNVIEAYAAVAPEVADEVLILLSARSRT